MKDYKKLISNFKKKTKNCIILNSFLIIQYFRKAELNSKIEKNIPVDS